MDDDLCNEAMLATMKGQVHSRVDSFVIIFIISEHVLYYVVRFIDAVPLGILVRVLDSDGQRFRSFHILRHSFEILLRI